MTEGICCLDDLGVLSFRGLDARKFLQGQLSNDVSALSAGALLRAGLHNPQGRTLALLTLSAGKADEVLAVLPRELLVDTATVLKRYVLRAKVSIQDESAAYRVLGIIEGGTRRIAIIAAGEPVTPTQELTRAAWRALDIAAGLPQIYLPTSGQFVAQMLNLDCIEAISFQKGCYTGQEVIARAHYRGRVKRRMQRFISAAALRLSPGDAGRLTDGRSFRVVDAVQHDDGRCEFLAVAPLPGAEPEPEPTGPLVSTSASARVQATALPLPYALPD